MTAPLASCIIPVYNGADFLAEAVTSALNQTYPALEVVIVDDGSTDRTPEVARSFGERVRYLRQENAGPAVARNTGLAAARARRNHSVASVCDRSGSNPPTRSNRARCASRVPVTYPGIGLVRG